MTINTNRTLIPNQAASSVAAAASQIKQAAQSQVAETAKNKVATVSERVKSLEAKSLAEAHQVKDASTRFQQNNFGRVVSGSNPGSSLDVLKGAGASHSKNPLDQQGLGMIGSRNSQVSEDPKETGEKKGGTEFDWWEGVKEAAGELVGEVAGTVGGFAWDVLNANDTPEAKGNEFRGFLGLVRQGRTGTSNENAREQLRSTEDGTPNPLDDTPSGHIYGHDIKGIDAKKGSKGTPTGEESSTGGPVNTGANGTGRTGSLVIIDPDLVNTTAVVAEDMRAIRVRIESKINVVR